MKQKINPRTIYLPVLISLLFITPALFSQIVWTKTLGVKNYAFSVDAAASNQKGELFITGQIETTIRSTVPKAYDELYKNRPAFLGDLSPLDPYMFVYKTDKKGDSLWLRLYPASPSGTAIAATPDGGFISAGFTTNPFVIDTNNYRFIRDTGTIKRQYPPKYEQHSILYKCNAQGEIQWYRVIPTDNSSITSQIAVVTDGYWLTAHIEDTTGDQLHRQNSRQIRLTKLSLQGEIQIDKKIAAKYPYQGLWTTSLLADTAANLILVGTARGDGYYKTNSGFIFRLDNRGQVIQEYYFGSTKEDFAVTSLSFTDEKEFIVGGINDKHALVYRLSADGEVLWQQGFPRDVTWYMDGVRTAYSSKSGAFVAYPEITPEYLHTMQFDKQYRIRKKTSLGTKGKVINIQVSKDAVLYIISPLKLIKVKNN